MIDITGTRAKFYRCFHETKCALAYLRSPHSRDAALCKFYPEFAFKILIS